MNETHCSVDIYQDSIRELAAHSSWAGSSLTQEQALDIHLAHEFFHIWEYRERRSIVDALEPVVSASFFGLQRKAHINRCGEIAAHAFAKELLVLPFLCLLAANKGIVLTYGQIYQKVWDGEELGNESNTISCHIHKCLLGGMALTEYARLEKLNYRAVWEVRKAIRRKFVQL